MSLLVVLAFPELLVFGIIVVYGTVQMARGKVDW